MPRPNVQSPRVDMSMSSPPVDGGIDCSPIHEGRNESPEAVSSMHLNRSTSEIPRGDGATSAGRIRKTNSSSARGVANLTPEQLARKRANDRQAQRAIRERTKAQIEALEQKVQELSSQQPYQDLQRAIAEKDAIQAENDEIKRRLAVVVEMIQPLLGKPGEPNRY
jgi:FtsZ-binding cell division protein ZapB